MVRAARNGHGACLPALLAVTDAADREPDRQCYVDNRQVIKEFAALHADGDGQLAASAKAAVVPAASLRS
jgi:hypothetical protein